MAFLPAHPALSRALIERNYTEATPVQNAVLEPEAAGRDLLVSAQTGSGKTVAYGLAIAATLMEEAERLPPAAAPLALIVAPTRELALQVERELAWLYEKAGARVVSCVGGMDPKRERRQLADGAHIVVGTPGRLRDHLERRGLDGSALRAVVLDEADEMLDLGFREDLEFILEATPKERRTLLFSATMPKAIAQLAQRYQRNALRIETAGSRRAHADIEYRAMRITYNDVEHAVVNCLRFFDSPSAIIFCATRDSVRHMQATLLERGFVAVALSGELSQNERNLALQSLRDGRARVCVATDVAARGIDLPSLGLVIHADLPQNAEVMQHRSGRTGRAGRKGVSVLLVPPSRRRRAEQLMASANLDPIWSGAPTIEEIRALDQERMLQDPLLTEETSEEDVAMARTLLAQRSPEDIAAALVRVYRSRLPAPEEVNDPGAYRQDRPAREKGERPPREGFAGSVWFKLDIGRRDEADPKWLLPMLCRRGKVTRQDIGAIRIFESETKVEVSAAAAENFAANLQRSEGDEIGVENLGGEGAPPRKPYAKGPRPDQGERKWKSGPRPDTRRNREEFSEGKSEKTFKHGGKPFKKKKGEGKPFAAKAGASIAS